MIENAHLMTDEDKVFLKLKYGLTYETIIDIAEQLPPGLYTLFRHRVLSDHFDTIQEAEEYMFKLLYEIELKERRDSKRNNGNLRS